MAHWSGCSSPPTSTPNAWAPASAANAFRRQLAPFIEHARKVGRGQRRRPGQTASSRERSTDIRAWAKDQGITVSDRGRIPASVAEQYEAATQGS
jgi:nucleoid-associated protein Lsr2